MRIVLSINNLQQYLILIIINYKKSHWQGREDSNPQPTVLETATLPLSHFPRSTTHVVYNNIVIMSIIFQFIIYYYFIFQYIFDILNVSR